ncbi:MAG: hypothetical protein II776_05975, partial [Clostridia bacterium]|nr:hypothetical protein [Clostridia bacterium]
EHLQKKINEAQFGAFASHPALPAAEYKLAVPTSSGKTLYTFCMCPGGVVVPATVETGCVVTNGMSDHARDGENANAALLVCFCPEEMPGDLFAGFRFQRELERASFDLAGGGYKAPAQTVGDFLKGQKTVSFGSVSPSYARGVMPCDLGELLPETVLEPLREGIVLMDGKLRGFADPNAVLTAPESRSTCPVRILRDSSRQSELRGLYPIGEGAGYAGGITSSGMDGVKSALLYLDTLKGNNA